MKVVLLEQVPTLGPAGSVAKVKPGYARNYLIPKGLATLATPTQVKTIEDKQQAQSRKTVRLLEEFERLKHKLEGRSLNLKLKVDEKDQAFGSVSVHDIVEALKRDEIAVEKSMVRLETPIKQLGVFEVPIQLHPNVSATLKLCVVKS